MNISVNGLGIVSKIGGTRDLEELLNKERIDPKILPAGPIVLVDIPDNFGISAQLIRRMSHFAKISLLSACYAVRDAGIDITGKPVGIIQGSVYGPIISGIQAFDDLIDFGDNQLSPTNFSGSVFNTSATYLSLAFGIQGNTLSHTCGQDTLYNSLISASLWLESGTADYVILGIGDEYSAFFNHEDTDPKTGMLPTSEGWTTFILSKSDIAKYGKIKYEHFQVLPETKSRKSIYSVWHQQIKVDEFIHHTTNNQACFSVHLRGSYPSASAFDLALALVCKKTGRFPLYDNSNHHYQVQNLNLDEKIDCYSISENNGVFCFEV